MLEGKLIFQLRKGKSQSPVILTAVGNVNDKQ